MQLTNIYIRPEPSDTTPRVALHSLKFGQRYKHTAGGNVSQVFAIRDGYIVVKRSDDWLVRINQGDEGWGKMVIPITGR